MEERSEHLFSTKDFNTIVLLKLHGYKFEKVTREGSTNRTKRVWVQNSPDLQNLLLEYENGSINVNMRDLMRTIEETKEFVHR